MYYAGLSMGAGRSINVNKHAVDKRTANVFNSINHSSNDVLKTVDVIFDLI